MKNFTSLQFQPGGAPSRRRSASPKPAAPVHQVVAVIVHGAVERRVAADRAGSGRGIRRRGDEIDAGGPGYGLRPTARRRAAGIDDQEQQPPQLDRFLRRQRTIGRARGEPRDGEARKAVIVDEAAIEQLDVFDLAVVIAFKRIAVVRISGGASSLLRTRCTQSGSPTGQPPGKFLITIGVKTTGTAADAATASETG